ncbi:MAG: methyltransferase family protein [Myxococcaceae bacterium]
MDSSLLSRAALGAALVVFVLVAVVLPTLRMRSRIGRSGYVAHETPTAVHRLAVEGLRIFVVALVAWCLLFISLGPGALGVWSVPQVFAVLAWVLLISGVVVVVIAQAQMGASWRIGIDSKNRTELVTHGLFQIVRNPIFTGLLLVTLGIVLLTPSPWSVLGWAFLLYVLALQVRLEEEHLLRLHGEPYRAYASRVGRFAPLLGRLATSAQPPADSASA